MKIVSLTRNMYVALEPLVREYPFKHYTHYPEPGERNSTRYFLEGIQTAGADPCTRFWVASSGREIIGLASLTFLSWDTEQLGVRAGKIGYLLPEHDYKTSYEIKHGLLEKVIKGCKTDRVQYLTVRVNSHETTSIHVLEDNGFVLLDGILTFSYDLREGLKRRAKSGIKTRLASPKDSSQILRIASSAFRYDRFHTDPDVPKKTADGLHSAWLRNSMAGIDADAVIIGEKNGRLLGFVTCKIDKRSRPLLGLSMGTIVLVAVDEKGRGKGVASAMTAAALDWFREHGTDLVEVGTQLRNMQASRLYETAGFRLVASSLSMRKWVR
jgi:ribosomal protein S18 acetylase RimI-like enzyme